jgi:hypothetical protein
MTATANPLALFGRIASVTIGPPGGIGRTWSDLRITFSVERNSRSKPNQATVTLYDLDPISRSIVETTGAFVTLLAGYGVIPGLIFRGDISKRGVIVSRSGPNRTVKIEAGDGELAWTSARLDTSFGPGTPNSTILAAILVAMGLGIGPGVPLPPVVYGSGVTFFGLANLALLRITSDAGVMFSIQDGLLVLLDPLSTTTETAALLSPATGLIGAPTATKNGINARSLLDPQMRPGRFISLLSETYQGFYKAVKVKHVGDTHGSDWTTSIEAKPVGSV